MSSAATTTVAARWKLYGLPLSQPFRSVAWVLLQKKIRFSIQLAVPGSDNTKNGCRSDDYKSKSRMRTTRIPLLEDTYTGFTIAESPAIMTYLCENYTNHNDESSSSLLYAPMGSTKKATIDSYLHWHHTGTRQLANLAFPYMRGDLGGGGGGCGDGSGRSSDEEKEKENRRRKRVMDTLQQLEEGWFANMSSSSLSTTTTFKDENEKDAVDLYLAGGTSPTIADLLAYEELTQLTYTKLLDNDKCCDCYPNIWNWMQRMKQVPFHDEVHAALTTLGDVTIPDANNTPFLKRLGAANKKGIQVLNDAQIDFPPEEEQDKKKELIPPQDKL